MANATGGVTQVEERRFYTAERLCPVWPKRAHALACARPAAGKPRARAEKVEGGGPGVGHTRRGYGWRCRGGGALQTTGRANYRAAGF
ncbi:glycoside hydrolase family 19 protein, partial [Methylobacterium sp. J-030]|nr:glycoside hydrolase family 19 protein [Methylobacterium sp. J-030]